MDRNDMELLNELIDAEYQARKWRDRANELRASLGVDLEGAAAQRISEGRRRQAEALKRRWEEARQAGRKTLANSGKERK